jgi:RecG-like helicase
VTAIGDLVPGGPKAIVEGRVRAVEIRPVEQNCVFECTIDDDTGSLTAMFYGRTGIPGVGPGTRLRLEGKVSVRSGGPVMTNPAYELVGRPD